MDKRNGLIYNFRIAIGILILGLLLVNGAGCISGEKSHEIAPMLTTPEVTTPQITPVDTTLTVEKGNKESPKTPITVYMSIPSVINLNDPVNISITVNSRFDAPDTNVDLVLPDGISLVSGESSWNINLKAMTPTRLSARIVMIKTDSMDIKVVAKKVIDEDNSWGDMDIAYIGYGSVQNNTSGVVRQT